jgi:DNA invertase Pin-like site-specific DNA recombinase
MTNFAYLRVSTDHQDVNNQKLSVLDYCNAHGLNSLTIIEDIVSGKTAWRDRAIGEILGQAEKGDVIIASEISRLGRSTLQVLEIMAMAAQKNVSVHIAKNNMVLDGSMQSTITATILGLAAQIEREFISARTKEALSKRKNDGIILGRPKGQAEILKLDAFHDEIIGYLKKGINKRSIAKLVECSPSTLYQWLKRRHIHMS